VFLLEFSKSKKDEVSRSWFCVFNNPEEHGFTGDPQQICDKIVSLWTDDFPTRACAVTYCVSADGLRHCHVVLEDSKAMRFSAVKKAFPSMHIEPTKGNKDQAEDYINKRGKWEEKGEKIVANARYGEIKGRQGQRRDLEIVEDLLEQGKTPEEIVETNLGYRRFEKLIRDAYFDRRKKETPVKRDVRVYWHVGPSGSGKTYEYVKLCEKYGEGRVYLLTDYERGGFDHYNAEQVLCMDEFRGQLRFAALMQYLDGYRVQIPCRYTNALALWTEVHIFTVMPPERVYKSMVSENRDVDSYEQLCRRINEVIYHWKATTADGSAEYLQFAVPMSDYKSYEDLKFRAETGFSCPRGFTPLDDDDVIPEF